MPRHFGAWLADPQHSRLIKDYSWTRVESKGLMRLGSVSGSSCSSSRLGKALLISILHCWVMKGKLYARSLVRPQPVLMYKRKKIQFNPCPRSTTTPWYMIWGQSQCIYSVQGAKTMGLGRLATILFILYYGKASISSDLESEQFFDPWLYTSWFIVWTLPGIIFFSWSLWISAPILEFWSQNSTTQHNTLLSKKMFNFQRFNNFNMKKRICHKMFSWYTWNISFVWLQ